MSVTGLETLGIVVLAVIVLLLVVKIFPMRRVTIYEYQRGLKYRNGRFRGTVGPGQYWFFSTFTTIVAVDVRPEFSTVQGQEVLSSDGVSLKVSLAAEFQITDPDAAINKNANFRSSLYLTIQMALREIVGKEKIDALIENRGSVGAKLMELTSAKASEFGIKLIQADVKDIMIPGEMKKAFAQVVKAQKDGQASLERARGETAALRNLANAARMVEENPNLLQLRALQCLADSSGNSVVLGIPNGALPVVKQADMKPRRAAKDDKEET